MHVHSGQWIEHRIAACIVLLLLLFAGVGACHEPVKGARCGDGVCEAGEAQQCPWDCQALACGDGVCVSPESVTVCPMDCYCGNGSCDGEESWGTCPADCGSGFCGDGYCQPGEDQASCPDDCYCGNGSCDAGESPPTCPGDCDGPYCGDGVCDGDEDHLSCASDCPWSCEDPVCDFWPQCGCGTGDKCTINGLFERACTPIGASGVGELCTGVGDCDAETLCVGLDPGPGVYVCTQYCDDDSDCTDGDGALCVKSIPINATERQSICTQHCNPMDNAGCPAGTNCYVFATTYGPGGSECWGPPGTSTGTCAQSYQCAAGMMCDGFDNVCGFTCRRNLGNGDCPPPQICYGFVTPITIGTTEYGVCAS